MKLKLHLFLTIVVTVILTNTMLAQTTYTVATSGNWSTMTWIPAGTPGPTDNVVIDTNTVTADVNFNINNLTVGGGVNGALRINGAVSIAMVINGNLTINAGAVFQPVNNTLGGTNTGLSHTLDLKGNLTSYGTFTPRTGSATASPKTLNVVNITLSGSANSTLYNGVVSYPAGSNANMFNLLTINKTGGAKVVLTSNWVMSGGSSSAGANTQAGLVLVNGILETGSNYFAVLSTTDTLVRGYSSASYVNGCLGRGISSSGPGNKKFPVGDANTYELVSVYTTVTGTATGHCVFVRSISGTPNTTSITGGSIDKVSAVRYYKVSYGNIGAGAVTMGFNHFRPSYSYSDGISTGNTDLRVAYSVDSMAHWTAMGQGVPHLSSLTTVPRQISPDTLVTPISLNAGGTSFFIAVARNSGTTANSLQPSIVLYHRSIIEGFYDAVNNKSTPDTVVVELHNATSPFAMVDSQKKLLDSNGIGYITFSTAVKNTSYYIAVKHRNAIETWSGAGISFPDSSRQNYDFSSAQEQAFGSNLNLKGSKWCFYSGDVNHDGIVDSGDLGTVDNDNANYVSGYTDTDVNGDGIVDSGDLGIVDNNNANYVGKIVPPGTSLIMRSNRTIQPKTH
jgi:hypothetical protein